jgi:hypothetical protein
MKRAAQWLIFCFLVIGGTFSTIAQTPPGQTGPPTGAPAQAAPQNPPAQKVDPARETNIRKLLEVSGSAKFSEEMVTGSTEQVKDSLLKSLPAGEHSQKIVDSFLRRYKTRFTIEQLIALMVPIYDHYLSDEDIRGLIEFYQTPLGQRAVKVLPQVARESQQAGSDLGQKVIAQVVKEVQDEFPELKQPKPPDQP